MADERKDDQGNLEDYVDNKNAMNHNAHTSGGAALPGCSSPLGDCSAEEEEEEEDNAQSPPCVKQCAMEHNEWKLPTHHSERTTFGLQSEKVYKSWWQGIMALETK